MLNSDLDTLNSKKTITFSLQVKSSFKPHKERRVLTYKKWWLSIQRASCLASAFPSSTTQEATKVLSIWLINFFIGEVSRAIPAKGKLVLKDRVECEQEAGTKSLWGLELRLL